jgi:predicted RNA binding protein YcfA (HicA-like mRNA interferase family)
MAKLPRVSGREMVSFLEHQGFRPERVRGSHHYMSGGAGHTTVPVHGSHPLRVGTLRSILRDIGMSPTEFEELWRGR